MTEPRALRLWASPSRNAAEPAGRLAPLTDAELRRKAQFPHMDQPHPADPSARPSNLQKHDVALPSSAVLNVSHGGSGRAKTQNPVHGQAGAVDRQANTSAASVATSATDGARAPGIVPGVSGTVTGTGVSPGASLGNFNRVTSVKPFDSRLFTFRDLPMTASLSSPAAVDLASAVSPDFSAHAHLMAILQRQAPQLIEARDADTALAALDAAESVVREQRDAARAEEGDARDLLRRALQSSARTKANALLDVDQAEQSLAFVTEMAKTASRTLSALVDPIRVAKDDKTHLKTANDLALLLDGQTRIDVVRAAELLAIAQETADSDETGAKLFDHDFATLHFARSKLSACVSDLRSNLMDAIERGCITLDAPTIRTCMAAAKFLGHEAEHAVLKAGIQAYVSVGDGPQSSPPSRLLQRTSRQGLGLYHSSSATSCSVAVSSTAHGDGQTTASERESSDNTGANSSATVDDDAFDISKTISPVRIAHGEALRTAEEFSLKAKAAFPDVAEACLCLVEKLFECRISRVAAAILDRLEYESKHCDSSVDEAAEALNQQLKVQRSASSIAKAGVHRVLQRSSTKAATAKTHYLNSLALLSSIMSVVEKDLFAICRKFDVSPFSFRAAIQSAREPMSIHFSRYLHLEKQWICQQIRLSFADIDRISAQTPTATSMSKLASDAFHRYRVQYLHIASRHPATTKAVSGRCLESLRRCFLCFVGPGLMSENNEDRESAWCKNDVRSFRTINHHHGRLHVGDVSTNIHNDFEGVRALLNEICTDFLRLYEKYSRALLLGAHNLLPADDSSASQPELWSSGSSPLAAYCKVIRYMIDANCVLDTFLGTLQAAESTPSAVLERDASVDFAKNTDVHMPSVLDHDCRWQLRQVLRASLQELALESQGGLKMAIRDVGIRLMALLDADELKRMYSVPDVKLYDSSSQCMSLDESSFPINLEPSMPFVTASAFLEQQLGNIRSLLASPNVELAVNWFVSEVYQAVVKRWREIDGIITATGGMQLAADGHAIAQVFESFGKDNDLWRLPAMGQIFLSTSNDLQAVIETEPLSHANATILVDLLNKREDASSPAVLAIASSLTAALELENASSAFDI